MGFVLTHKVTIYYHHTDCGGVVYYARYLDFLEEARTAFFAGRDCSIAGLAAQGVLFVVSRQEIDYKAPAFYADTLDVGACVGAVTGVRIVFNHEVRNQEGRLLVKAATTMVCVGRNLRPQSLPEHVVRALRQ